MWLRRCSAYEGEYEAPIDGGADGPVDGGAAGGQVEGRAEGSDGAKTTAEAGGDGRIDGEPEGEVAPERGAVEIDTRVVEGGVGEGRDEVAGEPGVIEALSAVPGAAEGEAQGGSAGEVGGGGHPPAVGAVGVSPESVEDDDEVVGGASRRGELAEEPEGAVQGVDEADGPGGGRRRRGPADLVSKVGADSPGVADQGA